MNHPLRSTTIRLAQLAVAVSFAPTSTGWASPPSGLGALLDLRSSPPSRIETAPPSTDCPIQVIDLSTGLDPSTGLLIGKGTFDLKWSVEYDEHASTTEPRPAVGTHWYNWSAPQAGTRWISGLNAIEALGEQVLVFQAEFCIEATPPQGVYLEIGAKATDEVKAYLNQDLADVVADTAPSFHTGQSSSQAMTIATLVPSGLQMGKNIVHLRVKRLGCLCQSPLGLDALLRVHGPPHALVAPACCSPKNAVTGTKFCDVNGNGVIEPGEPGMSGWMIDLRGSTVSMTATTNAQGEYIFYPVPPGIYALAEQQQAGWTQTVPVPGDAILAFLDAFTHFGPIQFANHRCGTVDVGGPGLSGGPTVPHLMTVCNDSCLETCEVRLVPPAGWTPFAQTSFPVSIMPGACAELTIDVVPGLAFPFEVELVACEVGQFLGGCGIPAEIVPACPWDLNGDGVVDGADLTILTSGSVMVAGPTELIGLLASWGPCGDRG